MEKLVLFTIVEPKVEGKEPRIYYVEHNHFTEDKSEAHIFTDRNEAMKVPNESDFNLQIEKVGG